MKIIIGEGSCGIAAGAAKIHDYLGEHAQFAELSITGCIGMCYLEPIVDVIEDGIKRTYCKVSTELLPEFTAALERRDFEGAFLKGLELKAEDRAFLENQTRIALRNCGKINPESIDEYIAAGGYRALEKVLREMTPEDVIETIKKSGLAGRGGAGFPTWFKWNAARQSAGPEKYLICNADEGDPGAFMDRAVIESDPHNLIEGLLIGASAIGAGEAVV